MKVGVIGAGRILSAYLEAAEPSGVEIAALCDISDPSLPIGAKDLPFFSDFQEMAKEPELDAFIIAVPSSKHFEVAIRALKTGRPLLIEKPVTLRAEQFNQLRETASAIGTPVYSLLHAQFGAEVVAAREHLVGYSASNQAPVAVDWRTRLCDPYEQNKAVQSSLINSWVDGGINAISIVLAALPGANLARIAGEHFPAEQNWAQIKSRQTFELSGVWAGTVTIETDWSLGHGIKTSNAQLDNGTTIELHHTNEAITIESGARATAQSFQTRRSRLANHYVAAFKHAREHIEQGRSNWDFSQACHAAYFSCFSRPC